MYKKGDLIFHETKLREAILEVVKKEYNSYKVRFCAYKGKTTSYNYMDVAKVWDIPTRDISTASKWTLNFTKIRARDLALYTHWPCKFPRFWELLEGSSDV